MFHSFMPIQKAPVYVKPPVTTVKLSSGLFTSYTCGEESTGKSKNDKGYCITASGYKLQPSDSYRVVAADTRYYPFGTKLYIEGIGNVTVRDTGSAIKGRGRFDIFISSLPEAKRFGVQTKQFKENDK